VSASEGSIEWAKAQDTDYPGIPPDCRREGARAIGVRARARHDRVEDSKAMIAAVQSSKSPTSHVMSVAKFERFFRITGGLDVDRQDLKRYSDFINRKVYDLLVQTEAVAKAIGRVIIEPFDLLM
jgi:hypothetical protein